MIWYLGLMVTGHVEMNLVNHKKSVIYAKAFGRVESRAEARSTSLTASSHTVRAHVKLYLDQSRFYL